MFDGLRYICFFDVTSKARKLLQVDVQDDCGDYSEIRESRVRPVTCFATQNAISSWHEEPNGQTTFSVRSFFSFFLSVLRGTQRTLTGVQPLVPRY